MELSIKPLLSKQKIEKRVRALGKQITRDYKNKNLHLICVLDGAFCFMADLVRQINLPFTCDFIKVSSYRGMKQSQELKLMLDLSHPIEGTDVLVIEDILDSGKTLEWILAHLKKKKPKSLGACCLLDKGRKTPVRKWVKAYGFKIKDVFVVGYGLDFNRKYRNISNIYEIIPKT